MNLNNDNEDLIKYRHFMRYLDFCEVKLLEKSDEDGFCYRCKTPLEPLTYLEPEFYYQPCWNCTGRRKVDRQVVAEGLLRSMREFYNKILGDRYLQLFLVDDIYFNSTFPHDYDTFKKVVNSMDPPSRNDIWFLDWIPGFPRIICPENKDGIKIVNLTELYGPVESGKESLKVGPFEVIMPEPSTFDPKHHSRYSILNTTSESRKSKRFKVGDKCLKFYNTEDERVKAIFKLKKNGEDITVRNLTYQDFVIIKLAIMRNKNYMRLVFDIILEISKYISSIRDSVFLKNTVMLDPKEKDSGLSIIWTALSENKDPNTINISIL